MSSRLYLLLYNSKLVYNRFKYLKVFSRRPFPNNDLTKYVNALNNVFTSQTSQSLLMHR